VRQFRPGKCTRASGYDRAENDWYVEPAWTVSALAEAEKLSGRCWDPACGSGNIPKTLEARKITCLGSDIVERGFGWRDDFFDLAPGYVHSVAAIVSNPPYGQLEQFIRHALTHAPKVCVLARLAFLEGQCRQKLFTETPLARVWVSLRRISMPPGGTDAPAKGGSVAYAWFVFDEAHTGNPTLGWI
jgi:hypothetical protein